MSIFETAIESRVEWPEYRSGRGVILVAILWVLVVLAVLAVALAHNTKLDSAIRIASGERVTARWLARGGVNQAVAVIANDTSPVDWRGESWYEDESLFSEVRLPGGVFTVCADRLDEDDSFRYGLIDEAAKINLNTADVETIKALPEMTESLAVAIVEWRKDKMEKLIGQMAIPSRHEGFSPKFLCEGAFETVGELGWLGAITKEMLYGEDGNLNGVLDDNEDDGDRSPPKDNQDGVLDRGLLAYVTVYSFEYNRDGQRQKRININSVTREELEIKLNLHPAHAGWIVENRPYTNSIAELLDEESSVDIEVDAQVDTTGKLASVRPGIDVFMRIADHITIVDDEVIAGRVNINTASGLILRALRGFGEQSVEQIVNTRDQRPGGFGNIAETLTLPGMTVKQFKQVAPLITVRSNVFTVRSGGCAERTGITHSIEAVIARGPDGPLLLYWKESR